MGVYIGSGFIIWSVVKVYYLGGFYCREVAVSHNPKVAAVHFPELAADACRKGSEQRESAKQTKIE